MGGNIMIKKLLIGAVLLTSCQARQFSGLVHTASVKPSTKVDATCHDLTVTTSNYSPDTVFYINLGSQPPWELIGNGTSHMVIRQYDSSHPYNYSVDENGVLITSGNVECGLSDFQQ